MKQTEIKNESNPEVKGQTAKAEAERSAEQERKRRMEEYLRKTFGVENNDRVIIRVF